MFNLTLHDHLHLTFSEIIQRHNSHAAKALSRARWARRLRGSEALLVGGATIAAAGAAFGHGQILATVAASMAGVALIVLVVNLAFDFDASARAHAACGARLWGLRERYRALLSDLHDGALSVDDARLRRDQLIDELRGIYDTASMIVLDDAPAQPVSADEEGVAPHPPAYRSA
jgi:SMODS and SLOG-associating 2TM effector domain family 4